MANLNLKFLRGLQSALPTTGTDGYFYLTTDTHRLYTSVDGKIVPVNEGVVTVTNIAALNDVTANAGDFFYATEENVLCVYNGQSFIQINAQKTLAELGGVAQSAYDEKMLALEKADSDNADAISGVDERLKAAEDKLKSVATTEGLGELTDRVTTAEGEIDDLQAASHTHTFADTDVEDAIAKKHAHTFVESELNKIVAGDVEKWNAAEQNAKDYTDDEIEKLALGTMSKETADDYVKKSDAAGYGDILTKTEAQNAYQAKGDYAAEEHTHTKDEITDFAHTHTASEVTDFAVEVAKIKVENAAKADEATKATQDGNGKVIADTYAEKATTLAGYGIGDAYTKDEVDDEIEGAINTFVSAYITSDGGAIDKLQEIANWIDSDKDGAADVIADIEANAEGIENLGTRMDAAEDAIEAIDNHSHANKAELDKIADGDVAKWNAAEQNAKDHADDILNKLSDGTYLVKLAESATSAEVASCDADLNDIIQTYETKTDAAQKLADAKADAANQDAVVLAEAQSFAESKVTELAGTVYTKEEVYTKSEVESLMTWGSF